MASSKPQATGGLPGCAYFAAGQGQGCDAIRSALGIAGFTSISGPSDSQKTSEFFITPTGGKKTQISPPGTTPRISYDLESAILLVGTSIGNRPAR